MNEPLSREQVETIMNEAHFYTRGDWVDRARMLAHDTALRAQLAQAQATIERLDAQITAINEAML